MFPLLASFLGSSLGTFAALLAYDKFLSWRLERMKRRFEAECDAMMRGISFPGAALKLRYRDDKEMN